MTGKKGGAAMSEDKARRELIKKEKNELLKLIKSEVENENTRISLYAFFDSFYEMEAIKKKSKTCRKQFKYTSKCFIRCLKNIKSDQLNIGCLCETYYKVKQPYFKGILKSYCVHLIRDEDEVKRLIGDIERDESLKSWSKRKLTVDKRILKYKNEVLKLINSEVEDPKVRDSLYIFFDSFYEREAQSKKSRPSQGEFKLASKHLVQCIRYMKFEELSVDFLYKSYYEIKKPYFKGILKNYCIYLADEDEVDEIHYLMNRDAITGQRLKMTKDEMLLNYKNKVLELIVSEVEDEEVRNSLFGFFEIFYEKNIRIKQYSEVSLQEITRTSKYFVRSLKSIKYSRLDTAILVDKFAEQSKVYLPKIVLSYCQYADKDDGSLELIKLKIKAGKKLTKSERVLKQKNEVLELTNNVVVDSQLKSSLYSFFDSSYEDETITKNSDGTLSVIKNAAKHLVEYLKNMKLEEVNWGFLCAIYAKISKRELYIKRILKSYYIYLAENGLDIYESERLEYRRLLDGDYAEYSSRLKYGEDAEFIASNIMSNFPINSNYRSIYQIRIGSKIKNINLNTEQEFIREMLKRFIDQHGKDKTTILRSRFRIFIYYFEESLKGTGIALKSVKYFNDDIFRTQYDFYSKLEKLYCGHDATAKFNQINILVKFYLFLKGYIEKNNIEHKIFKNNCGIVERALYDPGFARNYEEGWFFVYHNKFEPCPAHDRWMVYSSDDINKTARVNNHISVGFDFLKIDPKFREDLKKFIWNHHTRINTCRSVINSVSVFWDFKKEHENKFYKVEFIYKEGHKEEFSFDLAWEYKSFVERTYSNYNIQVMRLRNVREFVEYISDKYSVNPMFATVMKSTKRKTYDGGVIITQNDYCLINKEFMKLAEKDIYGELSSIVFILFGTTKMRIGEIMNLQRDCIIPGTKRENGTAIIAYRTKTSGGEYIYEKKSAKVIYLLERAIEITSKFVEKSFKDDILKNYIFVHNKRAASKFNKSLCRVRFHEQFKMIVNGIKDELENPNYNSRNIRHTFVDRVYKEGIKEGMSVAQMASIAGNSYAVANQHYREKNEVNLYVEAMSKVTISGVDIDGNVLVDETDLEELNPVKGKLGGCEQVECINNDNLECLKCKCFITALSRIPQFEKGIEYYDEKIISASDENIKEEYILQKKLHAHYLAAMLRMKGKK